MYYKRTLVKVLQRLKNDYSKIQFLEEGAGYKTGEVVNIFSSFLSETRDKVITPKDYSDIEVKNLPEPTRYFEVGEQVEIGNLENAIITNVLENGKVYKVESDYATRDKLIYRDRSFFSWINVQKYNLDRVNPFKEDDIRCYPTNTGVDGLLMKVYFFGVDFSPVYQRGHVWTLEQKQELIKTIWDNGDIGYFAFNQRPFVSRGLSYEIVDGKQRLTALCEFYEDRLEVNGVKYSQMDRRAQNKFKQHNCVLYTMEEADLATIYKLFLRINRRGTPVDDKHIEYVEELLRDYEKG